MIKCRIHILNEERYLDGNVFVDILLPSLPPIGSTLHIGEQLKNELENKVKSNVLIAVVYAPKWFYRVSFKSTEINEEHLSYLSFDDAVYVHEVSFRANQDFVSIVLSDGK